MPRLLLLFPFLISITVNAKKISLGEIEKIEQVCQQSSPQCLAMLEVGINNSQANSRPWFRFKQLRLNALFELQKLQLLQQEVSQWLSPDDDLLNKTPPNFAVYVYIYHAKLLMVKNKNDQASRYLNKAVTLLSAINNKVPSPLRLIEIANLQISMQDYEQAENTLLNLEKKFENRDHPVFKQELYANLGHIALQHKKHDLHINYRKKSLKWSLETANAQQKSVAHYNLAWAYQSSNLFSEAKINYGEALKFAEIAQDDKIFEISSLRLIEVALLQGEITQAKGLFNNISADFADRITTKRNQLLYQKLKSKLAEKLD